MGTLPRVVSIEMTFSLGFGVSLTSEILEECFLPPINRLEKNQCSTSLWQTLGSPAHVSSKFEMEMRCLRRIVGVA